jgi:hypothetical protein
MKKYLFVLLLLAGGCAPSSPDPGPVGSVEIEHLLIDGEEYAFVTTPMTTADSVRIVVVCDPLGPTGKTVMLTHQPTLEPIQEFRARFDLSEEHRDRFLLGEEFPLIGTDASMLPARYQADFLRAADKWGRVTMVARVDNWHGQIAELFAVDIITTGIMEAVRRLNC